MPIKPVIFLGSETGFLQTELACSKHKNVTTPSYEVGNPKIQAPYLVRVENRRTISDHTISDFQVNQPLVDEL